MIPVTLGVDLSSPPLTDDGCGAWPLASGVTIIVADGPHEDEHFVRIDGVVSARDATWKALQKQSIAIDE